MANARIPLCFCAGENIELSVDASEECLIRGDQALLRRMRILHVAPQPLVSRYTLLTRDRGYPSNCIHAFSSGSFGPTRTIAIGARGRVDWGFRLLFGLQRCITAGWNWSTPMRGESDSPYICRELALYLRERINRMFISMSLTFTLAEREDLTPARENVREHPELPGY